MSEAIILMSPRTYCANLDSEFVFEEDDGTRIELKRETKPNILDGVGLIFVDGEFMGSLELPTDAGGTA